MKIVSKNSLVINIVKQVMENNVEDGLIDMLLKKELTFTGEEYLEMLVFLVKSDKYKQEALREFKEISEGIKSTYVERTEANSRVAYFILLEALNNKNQLIISKIIRNQSLPHEFLLKIAKSGNAEMLENLMDNQIKLIAYPEILNEMEKNPNITTFIKGKIKELREFYLENTEGEKIPETVIAEVTEIIAKEWKEGTIEEEKDELLTEKYEEKAMSILQQINEMPITDRIKLALTGSKTHRMILIRDPNKMVFRAVLASPKITIDEIRILIYNKSTPEEIIHMISKNRTWIMNYNVMYALILNPKVPLKTSLNFVRKLRIKELRHVSIQKNINPEIKKIAMNFYRKKTGVKE